MTNVNDTFAFLCKVPLFSNLPEPDLLKICESTRDVDLTSGEILFGAVGDETRLEYTVIGDAVNLSAKLEKMNKVAAVRGICDRQTYDLACDQGFAPPGAPKVLVAAAVPGIERPLDLVVIAP